MSWILQPRDWNKTFPGTCAAQHSTGMEFFNPFRTLDPQKEEEKEMRGWGGDEPQVSFYSQGIKSRKQRNTRSSGLNSCPAQEEQRPTCDYTLKERKKKRKLQNPLGEGEISAPWADFGITTSSAALASPCGTAKQQWAGSSLFPAQEKADRSFQKMHQLQKFFLEGFC